MGVPIPQRAPALPQGDTREGPPRGTAARPPRPPRTVVSCLGKGCPDVEPLVTAAPARLDVDMQTSRNSDVDTTAPDADVDPGGIRLELMDERARADQLATALVSNRRIGIAVGLVMAHRRCSDIESFAVLRQASMDTNRRLADVAEDVIGLRRLATPPRSRRRR